MSRKRKNGEGCWGERTINGSKYKFFKDTNGKFTYGKTVAEIQNKIDKKKEKESDLIGNIGVNKQTIFGDYISAWLMQKIQGTVEQTTYDTYENTINSFIIEYKDYDICHMQLQSINDKIFQEYLISLNNNYSHNSVLKVWGLIKRCITYAEISHDIKPIYLKELVSTPKESMSKVKKRIIEIPDLKDIENITKECYKKCDNGKDYYGNASKVIILIMYSGMRVSEATGIRWEDINFQEKEISIKEAYTKIKDRIDGANVKYKYISKGTKSESSKRTIPMSDECYNVLQYFLKYKTKESDYCCINDRTKIPYSRRQIETALSVILSNCGITKHITPHGLRHGFGSILISKGINIKVVSELLGHSDVYFTYNVYISLFKQDKMQAMEIFNNIKGEDKQCQEEEESIQQRK